MLGIFGRMIDLTLGAATGILLPFVGSTGASRIFTGNWRPWYRSLKKPWFNPPEIAFPIVWTYLYGTMGYASYMVYRDGGGCDGPARFPLMLYGAQLAVNWAFTPIFFGARRLGWGTVDCALLWVLVAATGRAFYDINPTAGMLFAPYLAWCTLATALGYCLWKGNPNAGDKKE